MVKQVHLIGNNLYLSFEKVTTVMSHYRRNWFRIIIQNNLRQVQLLAEKSESELFFCETCFCHQYILLLEMIHFTGDIYENHVPQHLLPFQLSIIFHFSRQKLVLRQLFSESRFQVIFFCKWVGYQSSLFDSSIKGYHQKVCNFPLGGKIKISC